ncbi:MAG: trypsin-like peptidase domain-containing protein [Abditibacteriota bacterium]|nr:trypsin-like peptidase domain-containing protein [Abditibacteriota bacterium]
MKMKTFIAYVVIFVLGFGCCALILKTTNKTGVISNVTTQATTQQPIEDDMTGNNRVQVIAAKISEYVVNIDTVGIVQDNQSYFSMPQEMKGRASGVIISKDGYILTNNHVVENANKVKVTLNNDTSYDAKIIGTDPRTDMAVIKIDAKDLKFANFADSNKVKVGEYVIAVGNALGLGTTVTTGVVSAKREQFDLNGKAFESIIQTDASINQGNSGGALSDLNGNLIGINTAIASQSGGSIGIGFAVPSNTAKRIADELIQNGTVKRAWLGIAMAGYNEDYRKALVDQGVPSLPEKDGVMVAQVYEKSPAEKAGIKKGDIILSIDDVDLAKLKKDNESVMKISTLVSEKKVGDTITLKLLSGGQEKTVTVTLGQMPDENKLNPPQGGMQPMPRGGMPPQGMGGPQGGRGDMPFPFPFGGE